VDAEPEPARHGLEIQRLADAARHWPLVLWLVGTLPPFLVFGTAHQERAWGDEVEGDLHAVCAPDRPLRQARPHALPEEINDPCLPAGTLRVACRLTPVGTALVANGKQVGRALEQSLDDLGDVGAGAGLDAAIQFLLGQRRQAGQVAAHLARFLVEGEHRLQIVREVIPFLVLGGELELDGLVVLSDLTDDALLGQLLAGPAKGVARGQLASDRLVESAIAQGGDEVEVLDGHPRATPGDDFPEQSRARGDGQDAVDRPRQGCHGLHSFF